MQTISEGLSGADFSCDVLVGNTTTGSTKEVKETFSIFRESSYAELFSTPLSLAYVRRLRRIAHSYDLIYVHLPNPLASFALSVTELNRPIAVLWHADLVSLPNLYAWIRPFDQRLLSRAHSIVTTSQQYADASDHLQKHRSKVRVIPLGISRNSIAPDVAKQEAIAKQFAGKNLVFSLGRLVPYKGFDILIRAARHLPDSFAIVIGGDGPLWSELSELITNEGLAGKVFLVGRLSDGEVSAFLNAARIFCLSSRSRAEAFGVVLLEAMRAGKPIVATDIPGSGVGWVNQDQVTGFNVEPNNPRKLAEALCTVPSDKRKYDALCEAARSRFLQSFTTDSMLSSTKDLFMEILAQNAAVGIR